MAGTIMTGLFDHDGRLVGVMVKCQYADNAKIKSVGGYRWAPYAKGWRYDLDARALGRLIELFPDAQVSTSVQQWLEAHPPTAEQPQAPEPGEVVLTSALAPKLFEYQKAGVRFLVKSRRALLADDMGLGKTVQVIAACEELHASRVLVLCPNAVKDVWSKEVVKWAPDRVATVLRGSNRAAKLKVLEEFSEGYLVVNYEAARERRENGGLLAELLAMDWDVVVVDEAHNVKNRKAQQTQGIRKLALRAECAYLLTGTPIMNRIDDLWSPLNMLYPKQYSSFWAFAKKHTWVTQGPFGWQIDGRPRAPEALRRELAPIMLRREKQEVFPDMPPKMYQKLWVDLEGEQLRVYKEIEELAMAQVTEDMLVITPGVLARLTRCRQVAISPGLIGGESTGAKLDALLGVLHGTEKKVIVFSQFAQAIKLVSRILTEEGIPHLTMTGDTPDADRAGAVERFQTDPGIQVILMTTQLGGVGLTLTAASVVVFLDKMWTPAQNEQAVDRTRPHLQKESVQVIEILARDTVDEMVEEVLGGKVSIIEAVVARKRKVGGIDKL